LVVAAFGFRYVGGLAPCEMCIWQRWPHVAAVVLGAACLATGHRALVWLGALAMIIGAGLGLFHAGVEQGWWEGVTACAGGAGLAMDADALFDQIMNAPMVRCDQIAWSFAGLSMAAWNGLLSAALAALWLSALAGRQQQ